MTPNLNTPKWARTTNLRLRRPLLYPVELPVHKTKGEGFEPSMRNNPHTRLAGERLQPLGHPFKIVCHRIPKFLSPSERAAFYAFFPIRASFFFNFLLFSSLSLFFLVDSSLSARLLTYGVPAALLAYARRLSLCPSPGLNHAFRIPAHHCLSSASLLRQNH